MIGNQQNEKLARLLNFTFTGNLLAMKEITFAEEYADNGGFVVRWGDCVPQPVLSVA